MFGINGLDAHTPTMIKRLESWIKKEERVPCCSASVVASQDDNKPKDDKPTVPDVRQKV